MRFAHLPKSSTHTIYDTFYTPFAERKIRIFLVNNLFLRGKSASPRGAWTEMSFFSFAGRMKRTLGAKRIVDALLLTSLTLAIDCMASRRLQRTTLELAMSRFILIIFATVGLYAGYVVGHQLGAVTAVANFVRRNAPEALEIARAARELPNIVRELRQTPSSKPEVRLADLKIQTVRLQKPHTKKRGDRPRLEPISSNSYPRHWENDPFSAKP